PRRGSAGRVATSWCRCASRPRCLPGMRTRCRERCHTRDAHGARQLSLTWHAYTASTPFGVQPGCALELGGTVRTRVVLSMGRGGGDHTRKSQTLLRFFGGEVGLGRVSRPPATLARGCP